MASRELTPRRKEILDFIVRMTEERGYPPTVRDIGEAVGLRSSSTVHFHLKALEDGGFIQRDGTLTRAIRFTGGRSEGRPEPTRYVPVVGRVAAGQPIFADQNIEDMLPLPDNLFPPGDLFMLKVNGESMIEDGILDGDFVVVQRQHTAENGDTVVAMLEDEATVKRFFRHPTHVELRPANAQMQPIIVRRVEVLGRVCGVIRTMR